jgi:hypothetical protein
MAKVITCDSRDARAFCTRRAEKIHRDGPFIAVAECWKKLCLKTLENQEIWTKSESEPVLCSENYLHPGLYGDVPSKICFWIFKNRIYLHNDDFDFSYEEFKLLVREEFDKERRHFEKLQTKFTGLAEISRERTKIPSSVRIFVWQRDGGRCADCGSNENLEYDHIIPFSKGGSNTERNIQLLCGNCNRLKSDRIQ